MRPARRRQLAQWLRTTFGASIEHACRLAHFSRTAWYRTSRAVDQTALRMRIRELAIGLGPNVRVNGIAPATVVAGSSMFPRDRVIASLQKYAIAYRDDESTEEPPP